MFQPAILQFSMSKTRAYAFTINNPSISDDLEIELLKDKVDYLCYGRETGDLGTLHYQGYCKFPHPVTLQRVSSLLSRAHIERAKGNSQQNIDYCSKDGNFTEHGTRPTSSKVDKKQMWRDIIKCAEEGNLDKIKEDYPHAYFLHFKKIQDFRKRYLGIIQGQLEHEWWVGPTGTGKSSKLWAEYPNHYGKGLNKWWDGYEDEDVVAIEEMTPEAGKYLAHFIKIWADRYPFSPEVKGGQLKKIRPKKIIILSNYTPEECFSNEQDLLPIKRRFKVVTFNTL